VDDVLADAVVAVLHRMRSPRPLVVDTPAAYGTAAIRSAVRRLAQDRSASVEGDRHLLDEVGRGTAQEPDRADVTAGDDLRVMVEAAGGRAWVTSAALAWVTFAMYPAALPSGLPRPRAGAREDQARCWPALWLAGERDLFPDDHGDDAAQRRTRARRIAAVLERLEQAHARLRLAGGASHG
jgi:hypothetical protein